MKMFNKLICTSVLSATLAMVCSNTALGEETATAAPATQAPVAEKSPDAIRIARLAELSGKTQDEIMKMRTEKHMGWGEIAKQLGVPPSELGKSVSDDRRDANQKRRDERRKDREEKREARDKKVNEKSNSGNH